MQHRNSAHWRGLFLFEFLLIILIILLGYWSKHCPLRHFWFLVRIPVSGIAISTMSTKIKGICKSLKYITQLFVVKEREIEIGYPTDVKHVAHIGWDGPSGSGPSWMSEFKTAPDFSTSLGNLDDRRDPNPLSTTIMPPQDNAESSQASSSAINDTQSHEQPRVPKKNKRKKTKLGSAKSPLTPFSSSLKQSKTAKPKTNTYNEMEAPSPVVKV